MGAVALMVIIVFVSIFLLGFLPPLKTLQLTNFENSSWWMGFSMMLVQIAETAIGIIIAAIFYHVFLT